MGNQYRYSVLYTQVLKQEKLRDILKMAMPEGRGCVFYPSMEVYRRGSGGGRTEIIPMFPGYIFIRSDMGEKELHHLIGSCRGKLSTFIRELSLSEKRAAEISPFEDSGEEANDCILSDLGEDEAAFMDFLLDAGNTDGKADGEAGKENPPMEGLLRMSYGYREGGNNYKVMEGPLRAYESRIQDVNVRDRKAYLDFAVQGRIVKAGFEIKPKRFWFPEDKDAPEVLSDGTEVDLVELIRAMTNLKSKS